MIVTGGGGAPAVLALSIVCLADYAVIIERDAGKRSAPFLLCAPLCAAAQEVPDSSRAPCIVPAGEERRGAERGRVLLSRLYNFNEERRPQAAAAKACRSGTDLMVAMGGECAHCFLVEEDLAIALVLSFEPASAQWGDGLAALAARNGRFVGSLVEVLLFFTGGPRLCAARLLEKAALIRVIIDMAIKGRSLNRDALSVDFIRRAMPPAIKGQCVPHDGVSGWGRL